MFCDKISKLLLCYFFIYFVIENRNEELKSTSQNNFFFFKTAHLLQILREYWVDFTYFKFVKYVPHEINPIKIVHLWEVICLPILNYRFHLKLIRDRGAILLIQMVKLTWTWLLAVFTSYELCYFYDMVSRILFKIFESRLFQFIRLNGTLGEPYNGKRRGNKFQWEKK